MTVAIAVAELQLVSSLGKHESSIHFVVGSSQLENPIDKKLLHNMRPFARARHVCYRYIGKKVLVRLCCEAPDSYVPGSIARSTGESFTALQAFLNEHVAR